METRITSVTGRNSSSVMVDYADRDRFGGEAVSLEVNYANKEEFAAAGYAPFMVDGTEYGEVRQYGNFSFLRVYEVSITLITLSLSFVSLIAL
jgi:hypothetical protein